MEKLWKARRLSVRAIPRNYGAHMYWWVSFFQVFVLQGILLWLISAPLLSAQYYSDRSFGFLDVMASILWIVGFAFEAGGDYQLTKFKNNPANIGKVLNTGFWRYTRHPNYFGDACVWWGFALFSVAAGSYWPVLSSLLMTFLLLKVSGVALLEKTFEVLKARIRIVYSQHEFFFPMVPPKKS